MNSMINNLNNGNITEAKKQAKRYSGFKIHNHLVENGYTHEKAHYTSEFLKGLITWNLYCSLT